METEHQRPATVQRATAHDTQAQRLVHLAEERGAFAIPIVSAALGHADPWIRLHAVQGLAVIDHADARAALIAALHDDNFGVHWAAARALAASGPAAVSAVLRALVHDQPSTGFLHGAAYVLHHAPLSAVERSAVAPVLEALQRPAADLEAPFAAFASLEQLELPHRMAADPPVRRYLAGRRKRSRLERTAPGAVGAGAG